MKTIRRNNQIIYSSKTATKRVFLSVPMTGLIRAEWAMARYGQGIPTNWSHNEFIQWIDMISPVGYMVADARNVAVSEFVKSGHEWLFFIDHDVVMPPNTFIHFNQRMLKGNVPIWGGLYFTKGTPAEPLVYREWGGSYATGWNIGEDVWVKAMGNGCNVFHNSVIRKAWEESDEYTVGGYRTRKVFETPIKSFKDPVTNVWATAGGTEDIVFYNRLIEDRILEKAGWGKFQKMPYPYLCDTRIFCKHIDNAGIQYPAHGEEKQFMKKGKRK